jgi:hypothetical protein
MNLKSKILATAAALALLPVAGAGLAAGSASAATPSCGGTCVNLFAREYAGQSLGSPQFVADVFRQGKKAGQPVILFRTSNADPAEDWTASFQGTVSDFYAAGLVGSAVALHYGCVAGTGADEFPSCAGSVNDGAYELEYAPYGVDSGLCAGLAATATAGEKVTLQPCGVSSKTVWIIDNLPGDAPVPPYYAAINGSDTNFAQPYVLTYPVNGYPTDVPRPELYVTNLTGFSGPVDNDDQLWTDTTGVLP